MTATRIATSSDDSAAQWAFHFSPPSSTNRAMSGSAAKMVLAKSEFPTGSKCCV